MPRNYHNIRIAQRASQWLRRLNRPKLGPMLDPTQLAGEKQHLSNRNSIESPLLRLPAELRNKILGYVCGGMTILFYSENIAIKAGPWSNSPRVRGPFVAIQQTCRQTYAETALLPFSNINQFWYRSQESIDRMRSRLFIGQINSITTIYFTISSQDRRVGGGWHIDPAWGNFDVSRLWYLHQFSGLKEVIFYCFEPFDFSPVKGEIERYVRKRAPRGVQLVFQKVL